MAAKELTSEEAKKLEELFLGRCRDNLQSADDIINPLDDRTLRVNYDENYFIPHTQRRRVKEIMEESEIYDKPLLDRIPLGRYFHFDVYEFGIFDKTKKIAISAYVRCNLKDFVKEEKSATPTPSSDVESIRLAAMEEPDVFHYVGILGMCGFEDAARRLPLAGPNWEIALVTHVEGTAFSVTHGDKARRKAVMALFDPEKKSEKFWRAKNLITSSPELTVSGGFVILSDLVESSGLSGELVKKAAEEFCAQDKSVSMERVEGKLIIKHSRV